MAFAEGSADMGAIHAFLLGPFLYYGVFGQQVSFETFAYVVSATAIAGILSGWFLAAMEWLTMFPTIVAAIAASVYMASRHARDTQADGGRNAKVGGPENV
jgi:hypothetical protein